MSLSHSPFSTANKPSANCCRTAWVETASGKTGSCAAVLGSGLGTPLNCPYCDNAPYRGVMASFTPCISMVMSSDNTTKLADKETWGRRKVRTAFHSVSARRFCNTACCTDSLFCKAVCNASSKLKDACFCAAKPLIVDTRTSPIPIHLLLTLSLKYFISLYTCVTVLPVCAASETRHNQLHNSLTIALFKRFLRKELLKTNVDEFDGVNNGHQINLFLAKTRIDLATHTAQEGHAGAKTLNVLQLLRLYGETIIVDQGIHKAYSMRIDSCQIEKILHQWLNHLPNAAAVRQGFFNLPCDATYRFIEQITNQLIFAGIKAVKIAGRHLGFLGNSGYGSASIALVNGEFHGCFLYPMQFTFVDEFGHNRDK